MSMVAANVILALASKSVDSFFSFCLCSVLLVFETALKLGKNLPTMYDTYFYYTYLLTFLSIYLITLLSLRIYLKKIRPVFFYLLFSIPLVYFLLKALPFFAAYIVSLVMYSPTYYGTVHAPI